MAHGVAPRFNVTQEAYTVIFNAAVGAYAAHLFRLVNPIGGALFGVVRTFTSAVATHVLDKFIDNTTQGKTLKWAIKFFAGIAIASSVMSLAGFTITFGSAILLAIATIPAEFIIRCFFPSPRVNRPAPIQQQQPPQPLRQSRVRVEEEPEVQINGQPNNRRPQAKDPFAEFADMKRQSDADFAEMKRQADVDFADMKRQVDDNFNRLIG